MVVGGDVVALAWSLAYVLAWVVVAKLFGLYDRDQRSLRHLTVDEAPSLLLWSVCSTLGLALFLQLTPAEPLDLASGTRVAMIAAGAAFVMRAGSRWFWRVLTPPERVAIIGERRLAGATERKLELFPDIHVDVVGRFDEDALRDIHDDSDWLGELDRVIVASPRVVDEEIRPARRARTARAV